FVMCLVCTLTTSVSMLSSSTTPCRSGFCAGVDRAIQIVVLALKEYGAPVYVRHEIVHNRYVVEGLEAKGAVFVEELDEIPAEHRDRKSTRLNSSHVKISYAVFCLKKK